MGSKILTVGEICLKNDTKTELVDESVKKIFDGHDIVTCDLAIPIENTDHHASHKVGPNVAQSMSSLCRCKDAGITMARLAGNHIMDYGIEGAAYLMKCLEEYGIEHIGVAEGFEGAYRPIIKIMKDIKVAFFSAGQMEFGCAYEMGEKGFAWVNSYELEKNILQIKDQVDYIFLFVHAGVEDAMIPMYEWRERYRMLIHLGCDFVIATHPHIIQGVEEYEKGVIAYSLGNFAYDLVPACEDEIWNTSIMISFDLEKKKKYRYKIYPAKYKKGNVFLNEMDEAFEQRFAYANKLLKNETYYQLELDKVCISFFERFYEDYYTQYAVRDGKIDAAFLFHNIGIESHNYLCRRALRIKLKEKESLKEECPANPYEKEYLLWGMGSIGIKVLRYCKQKGLKVIAITDTNEKLWGKKIAGEEVTPISNINKLMREHRQITCVICTDRYYSDIRYTLTQEYECNNCLPWRQCLAALTAWDVEYMEGI